MHNIIERQYPKQGICNIYNAVHGLQRFKDAAQDERDSFKLIKGHFAFGLHEYLSGTSEYITVLRDPIERTVSHFYDAAEVKDHWFYEEINRRKLSLENVLDEGTMPNLENNMVRMLSGNNRLPFGSCTREMLEAANENLEKYFTVIGLQSRFDEFVTACALRYGWKNFLWYRRHRVGKSRPRIEEISDNVREKLSNCNRLDQELYDRWKPVIEKRITDNGAEFAERVARFKRNNARVNKYLGWWPKSLTP